MDWVRSFHTLGTTQYTVYNDLHINICVMYKINTCERVQNKDVQYMPNSVFSYLNLL